MRWPGGCCLPTTQPTTLPEPGCRRDVIVCSRGALLGPPREEEKNVSTQTDCPARCRPGSRPHRSRRRRPGRGRRPRIAGHRRPLLRRLRQRRLRRPRTTASGSTTDPSTDRLVGRTVVLRDREEAPDPVQPRPGAARLQGAGRRPGRPPSARAPTSSSSRPRRPSATGSVMKVLVKYAGKPADVTAARHLALDPHRRRRGRRRRAGDRRLVVPGQRPPARQGDVRRPGDGPRNVEALGNGSLVSEAATAGTAPGTGASTSRWPPTSPSSWPASSTSPARAPRRLPGPDRCRQQRRLRRPDSPPKTWPAPRRSSTGTPRQWGPYPFDAMGGVAPGGHFGFALENQTRPVYSAALLDAVATNIYVVVHELAHQWYGDSVSVKQLARHLAQRGLRDLRGVAVVRGPRRGDGAGDLRPHLRRHCPPPHRSGTSRSATPASTTSSTGRSTTEER